MATESNLQEKSADVRGNGFLARVWENTRQNFLLQVLALAMVITAVLTIQNSTIAVHSCLSSMSAAVGLGVKQSNKIAQVGSALVALVLSAMLIRYGMELKEPTIP